MFSFKNFSFPSSHSPTPSDRPMVIQQTPCLSDFSVIQSNQHYDLPSVNNHDPITETSLGPLDPNQEGWDFLPPLAQENMTTSATLLSSIKINQTEPIHYEKWENTFNMRPFNLSSFPLGQVTYRTTHRSQSVALQRAKMGYFSSTVKSLDVLRQNLQKNINKEIDEIIRKYLEKFFKPGVENIRRNNGENSVSDEHIHTVCRQMLEEAKKMYSSTNTRGSTPIGDCSDSEKSTGSQTEAKPGRPFTRSPQLRKRKESDTDSEASLIHNKPGRKKKRGPVAHVGGLSGRSTPSKQGKHEPVKKEGPKWNPDRLRRDTLFVLGVRANKALGFGQTRGRLYTKHPELFKYCGDADDKQWLHDNNLMPAAGGKAYMLLLEDVKELAETEEYRYNPGLMLDELVGFRVPDSVLEKMKITMNKTRTDNPGRKHRGRTPNVSLENSANILLSSQNLNVKSDTLGLPNFLSPSPTNSVIKRTDLESPMQCSPMDDLDLRDPSPNNVSPFLIQIALDDVSPTNADVSPSPSELTAVLDTADDPPLSAPFDITTSP